jgi:hypothetical protein
VYLLGLSLVPLSFIDQHSILLLNQAMPMTLTKARANCRVVNDEMEGEFKIDKSGLVSKSTRPSLFATDIAGYNQAIHTHYR